MHLGVKTAKLVRLRAHRRPNAWMRSRMNGTQSSAAKARRCDEREKLGSRGTVSKRIFYLHRQKETTARGCGEMSRNEEDGKERGRERKKKN